MEYASRVHGDVAFRMWRPVPDDTDGCADGPTDIGCSAVFEGHKQDVYSVVCRDFGNSIVSAGYDRMVREWDVPTGRQVPAVRNPRHMMHL
jgi:hypothetical protein